MSAKNPTPYTGRRKSKGRPSKFNELLWLLKRNNYAKYQEEIRKSTETSVSQRTIENYIRECVVEGVPLRRFRILRRIPFINRLKFRPLFTQKIGDRVLIYAPYVFPGKESVSILMWNAIILLYAFTGYILIQPQLVQYALLIYLVLSVSVAIRILVWYLFARSYGLYRKWKIAIIMKGKPHYTVSLDGNTTVRQIIEMALKFFSPKITLPVEHFALLSNGQPLDHELRLYQTTIPRRSILILKRKKPGQQTYSASRDTKTKSGWRG